MYMCSSSGQQQLKAREAIHYSRGEDQSIDALKTKFNDYCPGHVIPYDANPFFTCVERAGWYPDVLLAISQLTGIYKVF